MTCAQATLRLYLINPSNPMASFVKVTESRWHRYTPWKPLSLLILAALTPPEWDITVELTPKSWTLFRRFLVQNRGPAYAAAATAPRIRLA